MKIAILGAGHVGGVLGSGWAKHGHDVTFGTRDPKKIDSNPLLPDLSGLDTETGTAGDETVASLANASVVKIFNTTGFPNMADPVYHGARATMLYCGDDDQAKRIAAGLARDLGFDPVDAGPLRHSHLLESFALLWITLALKQGYGVNYANHTHTTWPGWFAPRL